MAKVFPVSLFFKALHTSKAPTLLEDLFRHFSRERLWRLYRTRSSRSPIVHTQQQTPRTKDRIYVDKKDRKRMAQEDDGKKEQNEIRKKMKKLHRKAPYCKITFLPHNLSHLTLLGDFLESKAYWLYISNAKEFIKSLILWQST